MDLRQGLKRKARGDGASGLPTSVSCDVRLSGSGLSTSRFSSDLKRRAEPPVTPIEQDQTGQKAPEQCEDLFRSKERVESFGRLVQCWANRRPSIQLPALSVPPAACKVDRLSAWPQTSLSKGKYAILCPS